MALEINTDEKEHCHKIKKLDLIHKTAYSLQ